MTPTVLAHEIGHLMGLGDDYQTRHSALNGRCGTLMANSENGVIDQQLADRLADIISKYNGLRCWKGTLNAGANWTVPTHSGPATCTDSWKVDLTVVETNKGVTGTATANRDSAVQCVRPQMMPPVAVQTMGFKLKGNRDFGKFSVKFQAKDWAPPGGIDTTGFSTLLIGYPIGSRTIDVPIISDTEAGGPFTADWPHPSNHRSATGQISLKCESCKPNDRPWPPAAGKGVVDVVSKCP